MRKIIFLYWTVLAAVIVLCIVGRVKLKRAVWKWILGIAGVILAGLLCLWVMVFYILNWRVVDVDTDSFVDGTYEVSLQQVGEPFFFGPTDGRLILKENGRTITKLDFTVYDDGAMLRESSWMVSWQEDHVEIVIRGSEQSDCQYNLYFDGTTSSEQLRTIQGRIPEEYYREDTTEEPDQAGLPQDGKSDDMETTIGDYAAFRDQLDAAASYIQTESALAGLQESDVRSMEVQYFLTAKGWPYAVICTESDSEDADIVEHRLIYNESYSGDGFSEYVYEKYFLDDSGNQIKDPQIMGFFLVDTETLVVTDEHTTSWAH